MPLVIKHRLQSQVTWVRILALPCIGCVTLGKSLNLSLLMFPHL